MTTRKLNGHVWGLMQNRGSQQAINKMYNQVVCEKGHDYISVTQTTSVTMGGKEEVKSKKNWLQCKKCGKTLAIGGQE